jgi:glycosyltransferase involved in cell wall biosynthesis
MPDPTLSPINDQASQGRTLEDQISIVMITHNRGTQIRMALEHLLNLPEKLHVIVVDNGSSDETIDIARSMGSTVEVVLLDHNLGCAARNIGVLKAKTPYVAFNDDDSWWAPGALTRASDLFDANSTLGLIAARIVVGLEERLDPLSHAMATSPLTQDHLNGIGVPVVGFAACGAVVRRTAFLQTGGFNPHFGVGGEEHIVALDLLRHGWQLAYVEDIVAHHYPSPVRDLARRKRHEVRNALWSAWLRRPTYSAFRITRRIVTSSLRDASCRAGVVEAIMGLPWVLPARDPVSAEIDQQVSIAEAAFDESLASQ